jgi:IS30 family transposase
MNFSLGCALYLIGIFSKRGKNLSALLCLKMSLTGKCRIAALTQKQLDKIVAKINNRPRKVLGYLTPYEVFSP